ncbi:hypothetical protein GCM10027615_20920 [Plantactinospora veratri]
MGQVLLLLVVALTVAAVVFGVTVLVTGSDPGLGAAEPDGRAVPLPGNRPLLETDVGQVRFDLTLRGYRMAQVDQALRRTAYDIGYKDELIGVLQAEVTALREGRLEDAEVLRRAREAALVPAGSVPDAPDAPLDGSSARTLASATTGGTAVHSSPVPPLGGPVGNGGTGANGPGGRSDQAETTPSGLQQTDVDTPDTRPEPATAADAPATEDRAEDAEPVPTRSVRAGGSVIEAEDGDLTEATAPPRPTDDAGPTVRGSRDGAVPGSGAEAVPGSGAEAVPGSRAEAVPGSADAGDDQRTRPARADATAEADGAAEEASTRRVERPVRTEGTAGPAEQPERA